MSLFQQTLQIQLKQLIYIPDRNDQNKIDYSECRILKVLTLSEWNQNLFTEKHFSQNFFPHTSSYQDYKQAGIILCSLRFHPTHGFSSLTKIVRNIFHTGFYIGGNYILVQMGKLFQHQQNKALIYSCQKLKNLPYEPSLMFAHSFKIAWILAWDYFITQPGRPYHP